MLLAASSLLVVLPQLLVLPSSAVLVVMMGVVVVLVVVVMMMTDSFSRSEVWAGPWGSPLARGVVIGLSWQNFLVLSCVSSSCLAFKAPPALVGGGGGFHPT